MTFWRQWLGRHGETLAERTLLKDGYVILEKNHTSAMGEMDLIARKHDNLVFCEVRSRRLVHSEEIGSIGESINAAKQRRLFMLAEAYLQRHPHLHCCVCRFDVILVAKRNQEWQIDWIKDAFRPGW